MNTPKSLWLFKRRSALTKVRTVVATFVVAAPLVASLVVWRVQAMKGTDISVESDHSQASRAKETSLSRRSEFERILSQERLAPNATASSFTPGNVVICRVGDGVASLTSSATAVFLDEYSPAGSLVQSIPMPTTVVGANQISTASGVATNECHLTRSSDGRYLIITGYNAPLGTATVASSSSATFPRVIGRVDRTGLIDTSTTTTAFVSGGIRSATSDNGNNLWAIGSTTGVIYNTLGGSGLGTTVSSTATNLRVINNFGGQLYVASGAGAIRSAAVGSGLPTGTGNATTSLPGMPTATAGFNGFVFFDLNAGVAGVDTLYIANDVAAGAPATATSGGILKFSLVAGTWTYNGTIPAVVGPPAIPQTAFFGLAGSVSGGVVTLYATRNGAQLITVADATGYNAAPSANPTQLATNGTNTAFRGLALAPEVITLSPASLFTGTFGASYGFPITASGGVAPYTFSVTSGSVPTGLTLNSDGTWSGTATATGTFSFTVTATDAGGITGSRAYTLTINPVLNVTNDPIVTEGNAGTTLATFTVTLTPASSQTVTVHYSTQDNTATTADNDYVGIPDTLLQFDPGDTSKNISVTVNGDTNIEPNEFFFLNINTPSNANISDSSGVCTITNDDANYTVTTTGNAIVVNDVSGNSDPLGMSEPAAGQVVFTNGGGRTFSVDGGPVSSGTSGPLSLTGVTSITVNQNAGNDLVSISTFTVQLPSLTINGGTGNDSVQFNGDLTFAPNANLDVDLQNDDPAPGVDTVTFTALGKLHLSGTGSATIKVSQTVSSQPGASIGVVNGDLTIESNQQITPTPGNFPGAFLNGMALTTSGTGKISILGKGGSPSSSGGAHSGLAIVGSSTIASTSAAAGAGTITLNGTGGQGTTGNVGVDVNGLGTVITSTVGNISITGHGGAGSANRNYGVEIETGSAVTSTGAARITINGTGGSGTSSNIGVRVENDDSKVTSAGGDISITGQGGSGTTSNTGMAMFFGSLISATNGAKITIDGTGGTGTNAAMFGVGISGVGQTTPVPTRITSDSGDIMITGHAGSSPNGGNIGFNLDTGAQVLATGAAGVTINGTGGDGLSDSYGVGFEGGNTAGTTLSAVNGNISITGTATGASGADMDGVRFEDSVAAQAVAITTTGAGTLTVTGTAGDSDPTSSGINFVDDATVTLTGGSNTFIADTMDIGNSNVSINAGANALTLRQKTSGIAINLGGADSGTQLGLTDAELDVISAGALNIGDRNSGAITISVPITRPAATNLNLTSGANIDFSAGSLDTSGGNVNLNPGTNVFPASSGADVTTGSTSTLGITSGKALKIVINNTTPDTGYTQLNVAGLVDISGVNLVLSGSYVPVAGDMFTIVNNDGAELVIGTFNGLPEGAILPNFLGSPVSFARITYHGGSNNNDVVLTVATPTASSAKISGQIFDTSGQPVSGTTVTVSGGPRVLRTITSANGFYNVDGLNVGDFYTVVPARANFVFAPASRSISLVADKTDAVFTGTAIAPDSNPLEGPEFFVRQQYLDFLDREPDQGGLEYWSDQLRACGTDLNCLKAQKIAVSAAFFTSDEFQQSGNYIYRLYRAGLGRQLTYAEFTADHKKVIGGADLESFRTQFANDFVARPEFLSKYQQAVMAETFVDALLQEALAETHVDLSSQREALIAAYNNANNSSGDLNHSRSAVLRALAERGEFRTAVFNSSFVLMEYFGYLQRDMDQQGFDFWVNVLNVSGEGETGNYRGMVCSFMTSAEYQRRFSPIVTHSNSECR